MNNPFVLVVDDEQGVTLLCKRILTRAGFDTQVTTEPVNALEMLERQRFHLLLVDIRMPGMDGFTLIGEARRLQPDLAVVVMTGYGTVETALETLRQGADGLILKPFADGAELVRAVQHALDENARKRDVSRLQALRPLFDISRLMFAETDPQRVKELLLDAVSANLHCEHAGLFARESNETRAFKLMSKRGKPFPAEWINTPGNPLRLSIEKAIPIRVNVDGPGDPELQTMIDEQGFASILWVPVSMQDGQMVLLAARSHEQPGMNEADLEMLVVLANQAAVAMENARLYEELRSYVRQVEESQRMLVQAEKMVTAGRLTASIAHEINNPLQAVQNCLHLASRAEIAADDRQEYLALAQEELTRLHNTVQRMLDFYRPGAASRKPTDVPEVVQRVLKLLEPEFEKKSITVQVRILNAIHKPMLVRDQIQQVLLNLLLNAMEAMPKGGEIIIEMRQRRGTLEILVEDDGPGIAPESYERIFEPFVSTKESGTGLGLTVSYGIITAHGGTLELVPGRSKGACFRIQLPATSSTGSLK